jgi:hypothetical protein
MGEKLMARPSKKKILAENKNVVISVTRMIAQGIIDPGRREDAIRAELAVRRRNPGLSEGRVMRRVRIRLSLLGITRKARKFKPFGGKIADLTRSVEDAVIAEVNAKNKGGGDESGSDSE